MSIYTPVFEEYPKAKPLAGTLVATAAEQGACYEDFELACKLALDAYARAMKGSGVLLSEFEGKAKAALDGF